MPCSLICWCFSPSGKGEGWREPIPPGGGPVDIGFGGVTNFGHVAALDRGSPAQAKGLGVGPSPKASSKTPDSRCSGRFAFEKPERELDGRGQI